MIMQFRREAFALSLFREIQFSRQGSKTRLGLCECPNSFLRQFGAFRVFKQSALHRVPSFVLTSSRGKARPLQNSILEQCMRGGTHEAKQLGACAATWTFSLVPKRMKRSLFGPFHGHPFLTFYCRMFDLDTE